MTTDIKPEMLSGVQSGNGTPHDSTKLYSYIGVASRDLFIDEAHKSLGIFPVFFPYMLPTPLCGILPVRTWFYPLVDLTSN